MGALTTAPAPPTVNSQQAAPVIVRRPFRAGAYEKVEPAFDDTRALTAAQVNVGPLDIPSGGYLRHVLLLVTATTAANAAAVTFLEDGPFSVLDNVTLLDIKGAPIVGPISGHDLMLANMFGGYEFDADPLRDPNFLMTTGAGATGGSFAFVLRIPVEAIGRDAIGAIANGDAAATLKVRYSIGPSTAVYGVAPTNLPNVRVQAFAETWTVPDATSPMGNPQALEPPGNGTLSMWSKQVTPLVIGQNIVQLVRRGNYWRNLILVTRNATPVRSAAILTDPFRFLVEGRELTNLPFGLLRSYMAERYGYSGATQLLTGVYAIDFTHEFDGHPGGELRDLWLPTSPASRLELNFTCSAAGTVTVLFNDVAPHGEGIVS